MPRHALAILTGLLVCLPGTAPAAAQTKLYEPGFPTFPTSVPRPLAAQIQSLFDAFFADAPDGTNHAVDVQVSYAYALGPASAPQPQVPILSVPLSPVDPALAAELAASIHTWFESAAPATAGARLQFDLRTAQPVVEADDLSLPLADVTDL